MEKSGYLPSVSVDFTLYTGYSELRTQADDVTGTETAYPYSNQITDNQYGAVMAHVKIPLFNRMYTQTEVRKAELEFEKSSFALEEAKRRLKYELEQMVSDIQVAGEKYHASSEALIFHNESFRYARQRYETGSINAMEFLEVKNKWKQAQATAIQSKYEFIFQQKLMYFYMGNSFSLP